MSLSSCACKKATGVSWLTQSSVLILLRFIEEKNCLARYPRQIEVSSSRRPVLLLVQSTSYAGKPIIFMDYGDDKYQQQEKKKEQQQTKVIIIIKIMEVVLASSWYPIVLVLLNGLVILLSTKSKYTPSAGVKHTIVLGGTAFKQITITIDDLNISNNTVYIINGLLEASQFFIINYLYCCTLCYCIFFCCLKNCCL